MTYYPKGGSKYNEVNPNVWMALHLAGYPEEHYLDTGWKDINDSGATNDPYWMLGGDGGETDIQFGLSGSYGIRINTNGISGFYPGTGWTGLMYASEGDNLGDHTATDDLDMTNHDILNANNIYLTGNTGFDLYAPTNRIYVNAGGVANIAQFTNYGLYLPNQTAEPIAFFCNGDAKFYHNTLTFVAGISNDGTKINFYETLDMRSNDIINADDISLTGVLIIGDPADTTDGIELLKFDTERSWSFRKRDVGANTSLRLESNVGGKRFWIGRDETLWNSEFYVTDTQAGMYASFYKVKIDAGGLDMGNNDISNITEATFHNVKITGAVDVGLTDADASLVIGDPNGVHFELDNNEIVVKSNATSVGTMNIQTDGGVLDIGLYNAVDIDIHTGTITSDSDNTAHYLGKAAIGYYGSDGPAGFGHRDLFSLANCAFKAGSDGNTYVNASGTKSIHFRINNIEHMTLEPDGDLALLNGNSLYIYDSDESNYGRFYDDGNSLEYLGDPVHFNADVRVRGGSYFRAYSAGNDKRLEMYHNDTQAYLVTPSGHGDVRIQSGGDYVYFYYGGETTEFIRMSRSSTTSVLFGDYNFVIDSNNILYLRADSTVQIYPNHSNGISMNWIADANDYMTGDCPNGPLILQVPASDAIYFRSAGNNMMYWNANDMYSQTHMRIRGGHRLYVYDGDNSDSVQIYHDGSYGYISGTTNIKFYANNSVEHLDFFVESGNPHIGSSNGIIYMRAPSAGDYVDLYCDIKDQASTITTNTFEDIKNIQSTGGKVNYITMPPQIEIVSDGENYLTDVGDMMYFNLSAVKELVKKIEELENRIFDLEN